LSPKTLHSIAHHKETFGNIQTIKWVIVLQNYTLHAFKSCTLHASHQHHTASIRAHPNISVMHHASYLCFKVSKSSNKSFFHPKPNIHWHHPRFTSIEIQSPISIVIPSKSPIFIGTPQKTQYLLAPVKAQYWVSSPQKAQYPSAHVKSQSSLAPVKSQYPLLSPPKAQYPLAPKSSVCIGIQKNIQRTSLYLHFMHQPCISHSMH
jgi:hypothetical protein